MTSSFEVNTLTEHKNKILKHLTYHFLPRDASAERGDATVSRPSVCLSICLSVTFRYRVQIGLNSSKIISRPNSLGAGCAG